MESAIHLLNRRFKFHQPNCFHDNNLIKSTGFHNNFWIPEVCNHSPETREISLVVLWIHHFNEKGLEKQGVSHFHLAVDGSRCISGLFSYFVCRQSEAELFPWHHVNFTIISECRKYLTIHSPDKGNFPRSYFNSSIFLWERLRKQRVSHFHLAVDGRRCISGLLSKSREGL